MEVVWRGWIVGDFEGYAMGRVYRLSNGASWRQDDQVREDLHREDPSARLLRDRETGLTYIDVLGADSVARVVPAP